VNSNLEAIPSAVLSPREAARYIGVAQATLAKMRCWGGSPPYYKLGRKVAYERATLDAWLTERRVKSTSDAARLPRRMAQPCAEAR
jgi:excisionase family DNA binding protein